MKTSDRQALINAVKTHAREHYRHGWDVIVECWDDEQIADAIKGIYTVPRAIAAVGEYAGLYQEQRDNVMCQSGEHEKCARCGSWVYLDDLPCRCSQEDGAQ